MIKIPEDLIPGNSFKIYYGEDNVNNRIIHIRSIVDNDVIVLKWWSKRKQDWIYETMSFYFFKLLNENGRLRAR